MRLRSCLVLSIVCLAPRADASVDPAVTITGELRAWHKVTVTVDGPLAHETDEAPNPFLDYRMTLTATHESGAPHYRIPGYFAADGDAAESSATSGNKWRAHVSPDRAGRWDYDVTIVAGTRVAVDETTRAWPTVLRTRGSFVIAPTDKTGRDFRAKGRLQYVGERYLRFAGSGEVFLKAGADSPENLLAYEDFDGTRSAKSAGVTRPNEATTTPLKTWRPHVQDWRPGDPTWQGGKGKGLLGALRYLAGTGMNAISFLTYNAGGDGDDVWPFVARDDKLHYDCSKLDQWQIVLDHAQTLGLLLHVKLQETENDDRLNGDMTTVPAALDGGDLGVERRLYLREMIARFGHALALTWNLGEENTQTPQQQRAMAQLVHDTDPYRHHVVIHTFPDQQDSVYTPLLGAQSALTGASLQNDWAAAHERVLHWLRASEAAGRPWVIASDEQNPHFTGVPPDPGYSGFDGIARPESGSRPYTMDDIRKHVLWGTLLAGGAGVQYYFGYTLPENDLNCEDWRSRALSWDYARIALDFFRDHQIPVQDMQSADELVHAAQGSEARHCFARAGDTYVLYLIEGGSSDLDLEKNAGPFEIRWFDPRHGGGLRLGSVGTVRGPGRTSLGHPPSDEDQDWIVLVRRQPAE